MNKEIRMLEDTLISVLDKSNVEVEVKRLILANLSLRVSGLADKAILSELDAEEKKKNENNTEVTN